MMINIDEIFKYLSWNNNNETQAYGIELASNIDNLSVLIMPIEDKSIWENCAKVLIDKNDEKLQLYLFKLFEWLKDMNWPGADLIYNRLIGMSTEIIYPVYHDSILLAKQTSDHIWEMALKDFFTEHVFILLEHYISSDCQAKKIIKYENYAKQIKIYLVEVFEYLKDEKYHGASYIRNNFLQYCANTLVDSAIKTCIKNAKLFNDDIWERNLYSILQM